MTRKAAILGGGIAGVTVAKELALRGKGEIVLFEEGRSLGGLQRSLGVDGLVYDIGTFLFTREHPIFESFPFLLPHFVQVRHRAISFTPAGNVDRYPVTIRGFIRDNGLAVALRSAAESVLSKVRRGAPATVPEYACYYLGPTFYERSGLRHYIERLYDLSDHEIGLEFAHQRLSSMRKYTPSGIVRKKADALRRRLSGEPAVVTLVRPAEGFGKVYGLIAEDLAAHGVSVHTSSTVRSVRRSGRQYVVETASSDHLVDRVVSTIPIPSMLELMGHRVPGFDTMDLLSLFYLGNLRHDSWLQCNFTREGAWKKLTAFSKCYGPAGGRDYFTVEITTRGTSDEIRERLASDFEAHAARLGVFEGSVHRAGSHVSRNAYPVFRRDGAETLARGRSLLRDEGIEFVGRQGNFEYSSSSVVAAKARRLSQTLR